jgi:hypothetical protein
MSIVVRFNPKNVTREKYDEVVRRLEQAGEWPNPPGLEFHVLYGSEGELRVSEIWDSRERPRGLRQTIFPIMGEVGSRWPASPRSTRCRTSSSADPAQPRFVEHRRAAIAL